MRRGGLAAGALLAAGVTIAAFAAEIPLDQRISAYPGMSRETRAMQDDDTANPATLWVLDGETLWGTKAGAVNKACADCHAEGSMKGVAARYPALRGGKVFDLEQRINLCHTGQQKAAAPFPFESMAIFRPVSAAPDRAGKAPYKNHQTSHTPSTRHSPRIAGPTHNASFDCTFADTGTTVMPSPN